MAEAPDNDGGIYVKIVPKIDWSALHGELTNALHDEARHVLARLLRRVCPVCGRR